MNKIKTVTISNIKFVDKWVEVWFAEYKYKGKNRSFDGTWKNYMLWEIINDKLYDEMILNGFKDKKLIIKQDGLNWILKSIYKP